jgi:hypothetical protein
VERGRVKARGGLGVSTHRYLVPYRWNIFHTSSPTVITAIRSIPFHTQIWDLFNNFLHHFLPKSTVRAKPNRGIALENKNNNILSLVLVTLP